MGKTFRLKKTCATCNSPLADDNQSGWCNIHRDRTGAKNSFFGKKHTVATKSDIAAKAQVASLANWQDPAYRQRVIIGVSNLVARVLGLNNQCVQQPGTLPTPHRNCYAASA
jgi:hypothetical protein